MNEARGTLGLFAALKNTAATLVGIAQTRLALISNEIQVEKHRVLRQLVLACAVIFCTGLAVLLVVALTTLLLWEQRVAVIAGFAVLFTGLAVYFYAALRRNAASSEALFSTSLSELQKDMAQLKKMAGQKGSPL